MIYERQHGLKRPWSRWILIDDHDLFHFNYLYAFYRFIVSSSHCTPAHSSK